MRDHEGRPVETIASLAGMSRTRPGLAVALAIFMFSLAGIPPLLGFFAKLQVFLAAVRNGTEEDRGKAREAMLKVFAVLGDEDPLTAEYRRKLSAALF